jgi:hypothetical protein
MGEELVKWVPRLRRTSAAERVAINAANRSLMKLAHRVSLEFDGIDNWEELSTSKASVVSRLISIVQNADIPFDDIVDKATQTVRQEIYAIEEWPTTKNAVLSRATAAIRRLRLGGPLALP